MESSGTLKKGSRAIKSEVKSDSRFASDFEVHYDIDGVSYWGGKIIVASGGVSAAEKNFVKKNIRSKLFEKFSSIVENSTPYLRNKVDR